MTATTQSTEAPAAAAVATWLATFGEARPAGAPAAAAALFAEDCYWRDLIAFSWNIRTFEGRGEITAMLAETLPRVQPRGWKVTDGEEPAETDGVVEAWIDFETAVGRGRGHLRLRGGLCWTLLTTLDELKGYEEPQGPSRPKGAERGAYRRRTAWLGQRGREASALGYAE